MPARSSLLVCVLAAAVLLWPAAASAFCRTTTCEPEREYCRRDARGCVIDGSPLRWPDRCLTLGIDLQSAARAGYEPALIQLAFSAALDAWSAAECGDGERPALCLIAAPACGQVPSDVQLRFELQGWPPQSTVLAQTQVEFTPDGTLEHAQVRINATQALTLSNEDVGYDLQASITHELGHVLGLDHSDRIDAAMYGEPRYGELAGRALSADDQAAVCRVYPPGLLVQRPEPAAAEPAATLECATPAGCQSAGPRPVAAQWPWWVLALALGCRRFRAARRS